jgi:contact-dependent growth inhibition (CDI) system restriction endonuclease-like protein
MDGAPFRTFGLSDKPRTLGLSCGQKGLALAGVPLLWHAEHRFVPRSPAEIARLLSSAYDIEADVTSVMAGLDVVAGALNGGDTVRAMIAAAQLKLPALDWDGAVRIARTEDALRKYSSNQPRDWHGRWTTGGAGGPPIKPQPLAFRPSGHSAETPPSAKPQGDNAVANNQSAFELPKDWVTLPPGQRIDELGDLLEWIANAKPEDAEGIRAEIKRYYYDVGDIQGGNALNRALSEALQDGPLSTKEKQEFLKSYEPYTREDPAVVAQMVRGLVSGILVAPPLPATPWPDIWRLGWAARGRIIEDSLGRNLPRTFPVIDEFTEEGVAISIKSINLNQATYRDAARLASRIDRYVDQLADFEGAEMGEWNIDSSNMLRRELKLAVPANSATRAQMAAIKGAAARAEAMGIRVIVVPY